MTKEDKIKLFKNEIDYIKNENFKKFAEELIGNADDYFFVVSASSSGKYHPQFDLGTGGLVRHTRCVAFYAKCIAESRDMTQDETDLLIISALAHDIKKQGNNVGHTVHEHPILASNYISELRKKFTKKQISDKQIQMLCGAVSSHMGKWGHLKEFIKDREQLPIPKTEFEKALQAADYIASRKELKDFYFAPTEDIELPVLESNKKIDVESYSLIDLENYVVLFGKHNGKTFKEIKPTGYLEWMCNQKDFLKKDTQELAKRYLYLLEHGEAVKDKQIEFKPNGDDELPF